MMAAMGRNVATTCRTVCHQIHNLSTVRLAISEVEKLLMRLLSHRLFANLIPISLS